MGRFFYAVGAVFGGFSYARKARPSETPLKRAVMNATRREYKHTTPYRKTRQRAFMGEIALLCVTYTRPRMPGARITHRRPGRSDVERQPVACTGDAMPAAPTRTGPPPLRIAAADTIQPHNSGLHNIIMVNKRKKETGSRKKPPVSAVWIVFLPRET